MKYPKNFFIILLVNAVLILVIFYFSDKIMVTKSWGGRELVSIRFSNQKPYKYVSCQIKPLDLSSCQSNTVVENFPNPKDVFVTPTKVPIGNPLPFKSK